MRFNENTYNPKKDLLIDSVTQNTDSCTVLQCLNSVHKNQIVFVAKMAAEIVENSLIDELKLF